MASGAYGFAVTGLGDPPELIAAPPSWRPVAVSQDVRKRPASTGDALDGARATVTITGSMVAELDRDARSALLVTDARWPAGALVHPFLAAPGMIFAWWDGREAFHGGAFVADNGRAWALLGEKGDGKSTTLAHLASTGTLVVADDLVVVDGAAILAGPRCVDLRPDAAAALGLGDLPTDARASRARLALCRVAAATPFAGFVHLAWGDRVALEKVPARERLPRLTRHRSVNWVRAPEELLPLLARPVYELRRPRDLASLAAAADLLRSLES